jgi:hypothetical protein
VNQVRADIRPLIEELAKQKGLPPTAIADLQATIASSPYLSNVMACAIENGSLKHLAVTNAPHQSGHYDSQTGTIHLNASNFAVADFQKPSQRMDNLAVVLGHETGHALLADAERRERYKLNYEASEVIRDASRNGASADLTDPANRYLTFMRRNEAMAELVGMNALASRTTGGRNGEFNRTEFLTRVDPSTSCVEKGALAKGIDLSSEGIQVVGKFRTSPAIEAVAQCYTDKAASIGQHGDSGYRSLYGAYVMETLAGARNDYAKGTTMHVPQIELNLAALKLDPKRVERAGIDLGGPGHAFDYVDISGGKREHETVSHTDSRNGIGAQRDTQADPQASAPVTSTTLRADSPGHPDHRGFEMFQDAAKADGRWSEAESRNIAAAGLAAVKADPVVGNQLVGVVMGTSNATGSVSLFGYSSPHGPQGPHHHVGVDAAAAARVPADKSLDRVEQLNQQHQQTLQQARTQSMETPSRDGPKMTQ